jgi:hypothetical protein
LTRYKIPRDIRICAALPKTTVGKIDKVALKAAHRADMTDFVYEVSCSGERGLERRVETWSEPSPCPAWTALPGRIRRRCLCHGDNARARSVRR